MTTIAELPETVDLAVISIPAEGARDAIRALCATGKAESIILIPGGFAETGKRALEDEIVVDRSDASRARPGGGPVLVGGNCLGIVSKHRYNTFFLPQYKLPFHDAPGRPARGDQPERRLPRLAHAATSTGSSSRGRRSRTATRWT